MIIIILIISYATRCSTVVKKYLLYKTVFRFKQRRIVNLRSFWFEGNITRRHWPPLALNFLWFRSVTLFVCGQDAPLSDMRSFYCTSAQRVREGSVLKVLQVLQTPRHLRDVQGDVFVVDMSRASVPGWSGWGCWERRGRRGPRGHPAAPPASCTPTPWGTQRRPLNWPGWPRAVTWPRARRPKSPGRRGGQRCYPGPGRGPGSARPGCSRTESAYLLRSEPPAPYE